VNPLAIDVQFWTVVRVLVDNELEVQSAGGRASMIDGDGELCRVELLLLAGDCYLSAWNFA